LWYLALMSRQAREPDTASETPRNQQRDKIMWRDKASDTDGPFVTFTEWASDADEKAYSEL
jgi:hypothetical protein